MLAFCQANVLNEYDDHDDELHYFAMVTLNTVAAVMLLVLCICSDCNDKHSNVNHSTLCSLAGRQTKMAKALQ